MLIVVDSSSPEPLWAQVAACVRTSIVDGELAAGDRLPPARDLAESLGVNQHTVLRAYRSLADEHLVVLRRRTGAVVAEPQTSARASLADALTRAKRAGLSTADIRSLVEQVLE
jgi:GntR family transcriptional regulator